MYEKAKKWILHSEKNYYRIPFIQSDSQDLIVEKGNTIHAEIIVEGGSLSFKIQKDNEVPVYEGVDVSSSDEFDVDIEESGTYTVSDDKTNMKEHKIPNVFFIISPFSNSDSLLGSV